MENRDAEIACCKIMNKIKKCETLQENVKLVITSTEFILITIN